MSSSLSSEMRHSSPPYVWLSGPTDSSCAREQGRRLETRLPITASLRLSRYVNVSAIDTVSVPELARSTANTKVLLSGESPRGARGFASVNASSPNRQNWQATWQVTFGGGYKTPPLASLADRWTVGRDQIPPRPMTPHQSEYPVGSIPTRLIHTQCSLKPNHKEPQWPL